MRWNELTTALAVVALVGVIESAAAEDKPATEGGAKDGDKGFFEELKDDVVEGAESLKEDAAAAVPDVPSGAVVAFNRDKCPAGWTEFPPAAGRVIRGTGDSGDGKVIDRMAIGEAETAKPAVGDAASGDPVLTGLPWLGLLICEKD